MSAAAEDLFDYVVVGAGTAGCVVAARLSEDASARVCLIEAGGTNDKWTIHVPAAVAAAIGDPSLGWGLKSTPQVHADNRVIPLPRGRVLGGSGSINGMVYFRGHPGDFDEWGKIAGGQWDYASVLPYFLRSENSEDWPGSPYHGVGGPMNVTDPRSPNPLLKDFLQTTDSLQLPRCKDFNGPDPEGFGLRPGTIRRGRRVSSVTAFLDPARSRKNLTILTDALVTRVVIEEGRARGVEIEGQGGPRRIEARREVVLCGGSFASPQLLLLSGVGDGAELQKLGIEVKHHLPDVGRNLGDHPAAAVSMRTKSPKSYGFSLRAFPQGVGYIANYLLFRKGPLAGNVYEAHGFMKSRPDLERPDLQIIMVPAHRNANGHPLPMGHGYAVIAVNVRPRSKGSVSLASPDPRAMPLIDTNLFAVPEDLDALVTGVKLGRRILQAPAFARYNSTEISPGPGVQTDEDWRGHVRRTTVTVHHPSTTCRMGSDEASVVDPELRVRGIEGLRVADASIFPTLIAGNSNAPVVMVAEKAADLILGRAAPAPIVLPHAA